jgi:hypothetical protein
MYLAPFRHRAAPHSFKCTAEIYRIRQRDGGRDQGESAHAMLLRFDGSVAQLPKAMEANSAREGIAGLAFVEFRCCLLPELRQF